MTDYKKLCAELVESVETLLELRPANARPLRKTEERLRRAHAALAETDAIRSVEGEVVEVVTALNHAASDTQLCRRAANLILLQWAQTQPPIELKRVELSDHERAELEAKLRKHDEAKRAEP